MPSNEELFERASALMPGGVSSPVRAFGAVGGTPRFMISGSGSKVRDAEENSYIDLVGSWGPLILGHAHPAVVEAVSTAASRGMTFGAPTPGEVELADLITSCIPSTEMVRFVSSGTEAAMSAVRLARAATQRDLVLKFAGCYHGHSDPLLVAPGSGTLTFGLPDSPGITEGSRRDTLVAAFNDLAAVEQAFSTHGSSIAAVIVEPIAANMGVVPPAQGFLEGIRALCDDHGALLIFDEVVTGFRVGASGAQGMLGIEPDLTILGKVVGGGMPLAAYGGKRELMQLIAPSGPVYQAGTLSGNPLSVAAGRATLEVLTKEPGIYAALDRSGEIVQRGLEDAAKLAGVPLVVQRVGSMLTAFFSQAPVIDLGTAKQSDASRYAAFFHHGLDGGIYWPPSQFESAFISVAHTDQDLAAVVEAASESLVAIARDPNYRKE
ncbi:MAG TPA: glutamate-1-semialdehyde 2,1-aminomutase [Actinomycetota bacterium]|nr:glutamate-1-semialdehyde 2,1-aminomutase [Actinomycetota bacterium]